MIQYGIICTYLLTIRTRSARSRGTSFERVDLRMSSGWQGIMCSSRVFLGLGLGFWGCGVCVLGFALGAMRGSSVGMPALT